MQLKLKKANQVLIVRLEGELDHHVATELRDKIDREVNKQGVKDILFDFEKLHFMDSSGIGVIIGRYKYVQKLNGKIAIAGINPQIDRIIHISGLHKIIPIYDTIEKALNEM